MTISYRKINEFKGENGPQSPAVLFSASTEDPLAIDQFMQIEGAPLSYNNVCDVDRLLQTVTHIWAAWRFQYSKDPLITVACKHGNPCGVGVQEQFADLSLKAAIKGDSRAVFGGSVMTNVKMNSEMAAALLFHMPKQKALFDCVIAPEFDDGAITMLSRAKGKCRLLVNPALYDQGHRIDAAPRFRYVRGGKLEQPNYTFHLNFHQPELMVYGGDRSGDVEKDLLVADAISRTSNSNTITIVKDGMLLGNGVGQQDRVSAAHLAVRKAIDAGHSLENAVACGDSFFPFADAPKVLIDEGIRAIFSTSGSVNDSEVRDLCISRGIILYQLLDTIARGFFGH